LVRAWRGPHPGTATPPPISQTTFCAKTASFCETRPVPNRRTPSRRPNQHPPLTFSRTPRSAYHLRKITSFHSGWHSFQYPQYRGQSAATPGSISSATILIRSSRSSTNHCLSSSSMTWKSRSTLRFSL